MSTQYDSEGDDSSNAPASIPLRRSGIEDARGALADDIRNNPSQDDNEDMEGGGCGCSAPALSGGGKRKRVVKRASKKSANAPAACSTRKVPRTAASEHCEGTRKRGLDGKLYIVNKSCSGSLRWARVCSTK